MTLYSSTVSPNQTITAAERNLNRIDILVQAGEYRTVTGTGNAITVSKDAQIVGLVAGITITFIAGANNTGAVTINYGGLGAKTIKKYNNQDLESGDIEAGQIVILKYDGTYFQMMNPPATNMSAAAMAACSGGASSDADAFHTHDSLQIISSSGSGTRAAATASGDEVIAHGLGRIPRQILFFARGDNGQLNSSGMVDSNMDNTMVYTFYQASSTAIEGGTAAQCIGMRTGSPESSQRAVVSAWDATNFTLTWTKAGSGVPLTFNWIALA